MNKLKIIGMCVGCVGAVVLALYGVRSINTAATPINSYSPKPGVMCAYIANENGVAISCWKD